LPVTLDQGGAISILRLDGDVNIEAALELKDLLVHALASGGELRVRLEGATALDIAIFQLLWVARREAAGAEMEFSVEGPVATEIARAMADAGLDAFPVNPS
jgi:anti-anti-sigma regulatory factor